MPPKTQRYRIRRIRMINFHNFTNETITVQNGGHLFLLGDNGSGKTTVLDAVHYVLTAGQSMEFNSAARVAGSRRDSGRREQGIVMRYNINAQPATLNPGGGVSYAAVELLDNRDNPLVLAVGLSCSSMEEAIHRWGIIRSGTLEEVPFISEELEGQRPRNHREMKGAIDKGYHGQIGSYRREVADRLFGGEVSYAEVCKFLATGKAYREIVSRTADYHQLFRELLQEPDAEVFEKVIEHLKSLDNSRQDLDRMEQRLAFLKELIGLRSEIESLRTRQAALRWIAHDLKQKNIFKEHTRTSEELAVEKNRLNDLVAQTRKAKLEISELTARIYEFSSKDKNGLVTQQRRLEHDLKTASAHLEQFLAERDGLQKKLQSSEKELKEQREQLIKAVRARFTAIHRAADGLGVNIQPVLNQLDSAGDAEQPEQSLAGLDPRLTVADADAALMQVQLEKQSLSHGCHELDERIQAVSLELEIKKRQEGAEPRTEGFSAARTLLAEKMFTAKPLYAGLEPRGNMSRKELSVLEQLIGEEILSSWLTPSHEEDAVRHLLFTRFPRQTLAVVEKDAADRLADWLRHWFDPETSDPYALITLQRELAAAHAPIAKKLADFEYIAFRARQQKLHGQPARLLGAEMRRKQLEQEIRELENELKNLQSERKKIFAALKQSEDRSAAMLTLKKELEFQELLGQARGIAALHTRFEQLQIQTGNASVQLQRIEEDHALAAEKLADIRLQIESEGLHDLEARVAEMKSKLARKEKQHETDNRTAGKLENEIERARLFSAGLVKSMQEELAKRNEAEAALRFYGEFGDASLFVSQIIDSRIYPDAAAAETERNRLHETTIEKETDLKNMAAGHEGQSFAFVYNREQNSLTDRRGLSAMQVNEELSRNFNEQREIITEETRRLFEQFIMQDLLTALRDRVTRLTDMSRRISKHLKDREFGSNRYTFSTKPLDQYKRLYNLIRNYSELAAENPARELKEFIDEHQNAILNTEPGDMPEMLDYRNWFHFDLQVKSGDNETTMNRQTKSIGSGGEQAVPNYLIILTIAHFLYDVPSIKLPLLLFDEAFYGIDSQRRDQLLAFASDLDLQLFIASPDQDGVKKEIPSSTSLFVIKDKDYNVHLHDFHWNNPKAGIQQDLLDPDSTAPQKIGFGKELRS